MSNAGRWIMAGVVSWSLLSAGCTMFAPKPEPQAAPNPYVPWIQPPPPEKSFLQKMFEPAEPPPPKTLNDWMSLRRVDP